uniref:Uncharacterized protein n=1 Tax=Avena sativa TaxID=4498 RepID=A0ACD5XGA2_AVESA
MDLAVRAMGTLLCKLGEVIKKEYKLHKGVRKKVKSFSTELKIMKAVLSKLAEVPHDQLEEEVKLWATDVRDLSYDMEDVVDSLMVRVESCGPNANEGNFKKIMAKMENLFKKGKARREISVAVEEIHARLQDVASRHQRYIFPNLPASRRTKISIDPVMEALYGDKKNIIGLEKARDEIIKKISEKGGVSKEQLKILSIVGFGGLGKTTLAKEVYDALPLKFHYKAFVSVSRKPDMKKVLSNLLFKLDNRRHASLNVNAANFDEEQLIIIIRELLNKKRYFIIIDDLWNEEAWKTIRYALVDDECGSIIITTTRHVLVSRLCCSSQDDMIHKMKSLSDDDSEKLFYTRIFSSDVCPSRFEQVSKDILKKCAGVPLAIISLACYLASNQEIKPTKQWYALLEAIGHGLKKGDNHVEEMKRILSLSFYDLPPHLKACFLYLSIFPEDHQINRARLIRRWISEGFIQVEGETSLLELGDDYFNELLNRNMIQPISIHVDGTVEACCVHDIMLDLICELSGEDNFVTILDIIKGETPLKENIRRLSLQKSMTDLTTTQMATTSMGKVRSFTAFSPAVSKIPPLSIFQVLRVLDLEGSDLGKSPNVDLRHVEKLLQLRYLGLRGTKVGKLRLEIRKLHFLQTLDLQRTNSKELPPSVVQLRYLMCLILDVDMPLPKGLSKLTCLEQLVGNGVALFSVDSAEELGHMIRLRELAFKLVQYTHSDERTFRALIKSLGKLHNLESLEISSATLWVAHLMQDWVPPPNLCRLKFDGLFIRLPAWISSSSLPMLSHLDLHMKSVRSRDIQVLGMLPVLCYLALMTDPVQSYYNTVENLVLGADAFPRARVCLFHKLLLLHPTFQQGAMPMVQRLRFGLGVDDVVTPEFDLSIRNMPLLQQLRIDLYNYGPYSEAVDKLRRLADDCPRSPNLRVE